jgi:hypothetical protein
LRTCLEICYELHDLLRVVVGSGSRLGEEYLDPPNLLTLRHKGWSTESRYREPSGAYYGEQALKNERIMK